MCGNVPVMAKLAIDALEERETNQRYLSARLPSGGWLSYEAIAVDPRTCSIRKASRELFADGEIESLPRAVAARATAGADGFTLELQFVFDPETGAYFWEIWDDNGYEPTNVEDGVTSGRGVGPWRAAVAALKEHAREYAIVLECEGSLDREIAVDAPGEIKKAASFRIRRAR